MKEQEERTGKKKEKRAEVCKGANDIQSAETVCHLHDDNGQL